MIFLLKALSKAHLEKEPVCATIILKKFNIIYLLNVWDMFEIEDK